jgi:cytochrome c-type biogenesis protein CcmE
VSDLTTDDAADLDLTPRPVAPRASGRRWGFLALAVLLAVAAGFVIWKGLSEATTFFYTADEAVDHKADLGDDRFRMEGTVVPGTVVEGEASVNFDITYNGVTVPVENTGAPPQLFEEGTPVVVVGRWSGAVFASDDILVKHDETYQEENGDRLRQAETEGETQGSPPAP